MKKIRLLLESMGDPIYIILPKEQLGPISPESLPISDGLKRDIDHWDRIYQAAIAEDFSHFGFSSEQAAGLLIKALDTEGESLHRRLQLELEGEYNVTYGGLAD